MRAPRRRRKDSRRRTRFRFCNLTSDLAPLSRYNRRRSWTRPASPLCSIHFCFGLRSEGEIPMFLLRRFVCVVAFATVFLTSLSAQAPQPSPPHPTQQQQKSQPRCADNGTYVNSNGETVKRPENCTAAPQGATAQCRDGSYSFSQSRRGTCSHHGGVAKWL